MLANSILVENDDGTVFETEKIVYLKNLKTKGKKVNFLSSGTRLLKANAGLSLR